MIDDAASPGRPQVQRLLAAVIAELVALAKEVSTESRRGAAFDPPLDDDQLAFYDAVATGWPLALGSSASNLAM